jgi:hypothetical protein
MHELFLDTTQESDRQKWITFCEQLAQQQDDFQDDWVWLDAWLSLHYTARLLSHEHPIRIQFSNLEQITHFVITWM